MRNCTKNSATFINRWMILFGFIFFSFGAIAQITSVNTIVDPPVYVTGGSNEVIVHVNFDVVNPENADFIEFTGPSGLILSSNFFQSEEYLGCGKNHGQLMPANYGANGIGWGRPGWSTGGSKCGAFEPSTWHSFRLKIDASPTLTGSIAITANVYGDGFNQINPSIKSASFKLSSTYCSLICPDNVTVDNDPGDCSAFVDFVAYGQGPCTTFPLMYSGTYPVGTSTIEFVANRGTFDEIRCTRYITVDDNESPYFSSCVDRAIDFGPDACSGLVDFDLGIVENCGDQQHALVQSKLNDLDFNIACNLGPTHYWRVYDLSAHDVDNDFEISMIELGIFESFNSPPVDINIYQVDGPLHLANLTLLDSRTEILPTMNKALYPVAFNTPVEGGSIIAVEVKTPINNGTFGSIMGFNNAGESHSSYISSAACNELNPVPVDEAFGATVSGSLVLNIYGTEDAIKINANHPSGLMPGDEFGIGAHNLSYTVSDAAGNEGICNFLLEVSGTAIGSNVLACNDTVRISMEDVCETTITPDMVLEGDMYTCYEAYEVIIYDLDGNPIGNVVTREFVGEILDVDVYLSAYDNRCSGKLKIEDYFPPQFACDTVTTTCAGDLFPGSDIPSQLAFNIAPLNNIIPDDQTSVTNIIIPVNGLHQAVLTDLDVILDISHTSVSDLSAYLTAPGGASIDLFVKPGNGVGCTGDDLSFRLDDDALATGFDLDLMCDTESPAISGSFQPVNPFLTFNGMNLDGDWILTIVDDSPTDGGTINLVTLAFKQGSGQVILPLPPGVFYTYEGTNVFTAYNFDACGPVQLTYEDEVFDQDCSTPYSSIIHRHWIGIDPYGNTSYCTQVIQVLNNRIAFLEFPPNYDDIEAAVFDCQPGDDFYPGPELTGEPFGDLCADIQMTYDDLRIDICPGTFKILRNWRVVDWCSGSVIEHVQVIKVEDNEGPVLDLPIPDVVVSTDALDCETDVDLPDPFADPSIVLYDCRIDEITYEVAYKLPDENGNAPSPSAPWITDERLVLIDDGDGNFHYQITHIPLDTTWIRYTFIDPCGNESEAFFEVIARDEAAPIAVCDEHTVVTLGSNGFSKVAAFTFDDGSHDNCTNLTYSARRMNPNCDNILNFQDSILFCCIDVGTVQMVEFRVEDGFGNSSVCMVEVEVNDKYPPLLVCPDNLTIDCTDDYKDTNLTGVAEAYDNCGIDTIYFADNDDIDFCGNGKVYRTWYAVDLGGLSSYCTQIITLRDYEPFNEEDIEWPEDITLVECESNTGPDVTGSVQVNDDFCSMVAITYKDQVFNIVEDACIKILRRWSVVDWCTFDDDRPYTTGYWEYTQVIKLMNTEAPQFKDDCEDLFFCSYGKCEGQIEFIKQAEDDCTPEELLRWEYHLDLYNDGIFEEYGVKSNNASGTYPDGIHRIAWIVEDGCGNVTSCEQLFEVKDCKKPTPLCISQLATVVMNNNGMVTICAVDFDLCGVCDVGSYDNCTAQEDLLFSFSADVSDSCRTLTCDDIPNGESAFIELQMWVTDEAGNQDYCTVTLDLQDNEGNVCQDTIPGAIVVNGMLQSPMNQPIEGVEIKLEDEYSNIGFPRFEYSDELGAYAFGNLYSNHEYIVTPNLDDNPTDGVSTLDLIYIQRHILELEPLTPPFQLIAADADNNQYISASDLLTIRKLILGINDSYPNGQKSWRFVSEWYDFITPEHPFPFVESINTADYKDLIDEVNFTGIKIGDINNSASSFGNQSIESRSAESFVLKVNDASFEAGEKLEITVMAEDIEATAGAQFTLEFNNDILRLVELRPEASYLSEKNFGFRYQEHGLITGSWNNSSSMDQSDPALFTLVFNAVSSGELQDVLRLTNRITKTEAYNNDLEVMDMQLRFDDGEILSDSKAYTLHQNIPNPFSEKTEIYFELPESTEAKISFFNLTGELITTIDGVYEKGMNKIEVSKQSLQSTGVIYYTLETGSFTQTRKMICIN